jgi:hypothetical protein
VLVLLAIAVVAAISADTWSSLDEPARGFGTFPDSLEVAVLIGAFASAERAARTTSSCRAGSATRGSAWAPTRAH